MALRSRYFTPRSCHRSHAATGAVGVACAFLIPGTVAHGFGGPEPAAGSRGVRIEHPSGAMDIEVELGDDGVSIRRAGLVRTARKIMKGCCTCPIPFPAPSRRGRQSKQETSHAFPFRRGLRRACCCSTPRRHPPPIRSGCSPWSCPAAGGGNDVLARIVGQKMGELLGQTVVVVNKPGAQGAIASEYVARQAPDGYTLMLGYIGTHGINPALQRLSYDPVRDFTPIGFVADSPTLLVVNAGLGVEDVAGLVNYGKQHPDGLNYASAGPGTAPSVAGVLFNRAAGVNMLDVPYKGSAPAMTDTLAGVTQVMFPSLFSAYPQLQSGKIRALAVAGPKRLASLPNLPTLAEAGVPGVEVPQWYAVFAPAGLDASVASRLNTTLNQALADAGVAAKIAEQGAEVRRGSSEELARFVESEAARWKRLVDSERLMAGGL